MEKNIKPNELRIGNYISRQNKIIKVEGCDIKWFDEGSYGGCQSIFLTEEWLLKLGFKKDGEYYVIKPEFHDYGYYFDLSKKCLTNGIPCFANSFYNIDTEYVHQLQNLYYALTGIELFVNDL